jgi:hypothetical protein
MVYELISIAIPDNFANYNRKPKPTPQPWRGRERIRGRGQKRGVANQQRLLSSRLLVARLAEGSGEPLEALVQTVSGGGAGGLDVL